MLTYDSKRKCRNLRQYKIRFSFIVEQILAFTSSPNMVRKVKNLPLNLQSRDAVQSLFTLFIVLMWIVRPIPSLNSKQFHQDLYLNNLYIVDVTCNFYCFQAVQFYFGKLSVKFL